MLAALPSIYMVSKSLTVCIFEACIVEFAQDCRYVLEATGGGVHGGSHAQFYGAAFAVASDAEMGSQAFQCGFGFVFECHLDGVLGRSRPDLDLAGLQFEVIGSGSVGHELDCCGDVSHFDPDIPVVQVSPELGAFVKLFFWLL